MDHLIVLLEELRVLLNRSEMTEAFTYFILESPGGGCSFSEKVRNVFLNRDWPEIEILLERIEKCRKSFSGINLVGAAESNSSQLSFPLGSYE